MAFHTFIDTPVGSTSAPASYTVHVEAAIPFADTSRRSRRTGTPSWSERTRQRESADPDYAARLRAARTAMAPALYPSAPTSLAELRLAKGLSQTKLAEILGTSQAHIAKIEAGKLKVYWDTATRLADALSVTLDDLRPLLAGHGSQNATPAGIIEKL